MRPMPIANRYDDTKVRKSKDLCKQNVFKKMRENLACMK